MFSPSMKYTANELATVLTLIDAQHTLALPHSITETWFLRVMMKRLFKQHHELFQRISQGHAAKDRFSKDGRFNTAFKTT